MRLHDLIVGIDAIPKLAEKLDDLRMLDRIAGLIDLQILLGNISDVISV